jgi:N-succinyldiaminopimelate aminotransferase
MSIRKPLLVPRMKEHSVSIFAEMSTLAAEVGAINLGQGFPDTDGPQVVKDAAIRAINEGRGNQYPPPHGLPALREAISAHQRRFYGIELDPLTEVVVGTGASEIIQAALLALVDEGDEVVMFEPWFDIYAAGISLAHGVRVAVPMVGPGLRPDLAALRAAVSPRTRVILINSPHNPTGVVFSPSELAEIARIAVENDVIVLSDEAYEHLWFDENRHVPIATMLGMSERTITVGSGGKTFSFTGWKVGWATGPGELIGAIRVVRQHLSYVSSGPFQHAIAVGLGLPDEYFIEFRGDMARKRDLLASGLEELGFGVIQPQGTYFVTTDIRPLGFVDGYSFCRELPALAGVVAIPHQVLCDDVSTGAPYVRWAFCKRPEVLESALDRLQKGLRGTS